MSCVLLQSDWWLSWHYDTITSVTVSKFPPMLLYWFLFWVKGSMPPYPVNQEAVPNRPLIWYVRYTLTLVIIEWFCAIWNLPFPLVEPLAASSICSGGEVILSYLLWEHKKLYLTHIEVPCAKISFRNGAMLSDGFW